MPPPTTSYLPFIGVFCCFSILYTSAGLNASEDRITCYSQSQTVTDCRVEFAGSSHPVEIHSFCATCFRLLPVLIRAKQGDDFRLLLHANMQHIPLFIYRLFVKLHLTTAMIGILHDHLKVLLTNSIH